MEKIVEQGILYDFYGPLLNDHQKDIYEAYVYDNMSLSELASEQGVSRQAVHDIIKRCDALLKGYEEKLIEKLKNGKLKNMEEIKQRSYLYRRGFKISNDIYLD